MMFRNSCFVSYRVGTSPGAQRIYKAFCDELHQQTDLYMPRLGVYLDKNRLAGGDFFADVLARELCSSVCMIVLFSPDYFDSEHTFCAREYAGMLKLEERRRERCSELVTVGQGLIIPVVIRGSLPAPISASRQCYSLSDQLLAAEDVRRKSVRHVLRNIADDVYQRYCLLRARQDELSGLCDGFALPSEADVMTLVGEMSAPPKRFPWR
jgi:hypothetical protein